MFSRKVGLWFVAVVVLLILAGLVEWPRDKGGGPYVSTLSELTVGAAEASECPDEICHKLGGQFTCLAWPQTICENDGLNCILKDCPP